MSIRLEHSRGGKCTSIYSLYYCIQAADDSGLRNKVAESDEDFVMITHNEVPSPDEAERTANPPPATHTAQEEHDGPNSDGRKGPYHKLLSFQGHWSPKLLTRFLDLRISGGWGSLVRLKLLDALAIVLDWFRWLVPE